MFILKHIEPHTQMKKYQPNPKSSQTHPASEKKRKKNPQSNRMGSLFEFRCQCCLRKISFTTVTSSFLIMDLNLHLYEKVFWVMQIWFNTIGNHNYWTPFLIEFNLI